MVYFKLKFTDTDSTVVWSDVMETDSATWEQLETDGKSWATLLDGVIIVEIYCKGDSYWRSPIVRQQDALLDNEVVKSDHTICEGRYNERYNDSTDYENIEAWELVKEYDYFKVFLEAMADSGQEPPLP